jgi:heme A synthase
MTAPALTFATTIIPSDATAAPARHTGSRRMWAVGAVAGVVSSLIVIALVATAEGAGVPMEVAENSTKQPEHVPLMGYGMVILGSTLIGLLLASAFARWARRPRRAFVIAALVLTAVSFAFPATTTATTATKVMLEITHVIPAALVIAAIAAHLPSRRVRGTAA